MSITLRREVTLSGSPAVTWIRVRTSSLVPGATPWAPGVWLFGFEEASWWARAYPSPPDGRCKVGAPQEKNPPKGPKYK